jgi:hypothetical protein
MEVGSIREFSKNKTCSASPAVPDFSSGALCVSAPLREILGLSHDPTYGWG